MNNDYYLDYIREAFISPIRSVLIVDDDYPTYEEFLSGSDESSDKTWRKNPDQIKKVFASFRNRDRQLLIDVHDGIGNETASHLHQSDLLVLDFQLDKSKPGDGTRAIEILRQIGTNGHFNLVVINSVEDTQQVFTDVLFGLLTPKGEWVTPEQFQQLEEQLNELDDLIERFDHDIRESISDIQYFEARLNPGYVRVMGQGREPFRQFYDIFSSQDKIIISDRGTLLNYCLQSFESKVQHRFCPEPKVNVLDWNQQNPMYIKLDSAFIAINNKNNELKEPQEGGLDEHGLVDVVLQALTASNPDPSSLFLNVLRANVDEHGLSVPESGYIKKHALSLWCDQLLDPPEEPRIDYRKTQIARSIARHSEQLMLNVLPAVEAYALRLIQSKEESGNQDKWSAQYFGIDLEDPVQKRRAYLEHNVYVSSIAPSGWHLQIGHIFLLGEEYWICLSAACDLVPDQISRWRLETFGERLPFLGIKLESVNTAKELQDLNSNRYLFFAKDGEELCFCFNTQGKEAESSSPNWQLFFAQNRGKFEGNLAFKVISTKLIGENLEVVEEQATVVGQLRYEYALNLLHKLGGNLTRIGLDFIKP
jgi:hypothetical protein